MPRESRLRTQGLGARLGLSMIVLTLLGGLAVSGWYMAMHHEKRDDRPGLTMTDIRGHYHGVNAPSPLLESLEDGHPDGLPDDTRQALIDWLRGDRISEDYDNLDLGDRAPAELIAQHCLDCHSRRSTGDDAYPELPLDYWDDVRAIAYSREIRPVDMEILAASTHTHSISLAVFAVATAALLLLTGWHPTLINLLVALMGFGLAADLASWWGARWDDRFVYLIVGGGFVFSASVGVALLLVLADLWRPHTRRSASDG